MLEGEQEFTRKEVKGILGRGNNMSQDPAVVSGTSLGTWRGDQWMYE